jgi:hypothetical protein
VANLGVLLAGSVPKVIYPGSAGYRRSHQGTDNTQLFAPLRMLRIRQEYSLEAVSRAMSPKGTGMEIPHPSRFLHNRTYAFSTVASTLQ